MRAGVRFHLNSQLIVMSIADFNHWHLSGVLGAYADLSIGWSTCLYGSGCLLAHGCVDNLGFGVALVTPKHQPW